MSFSKRVLGSLVLCRDRSLPGHTDVRFCAARSDLSADK